MLVPDVSAEGAQSDAEKLLTGEEDLEEYQFDIPEDAYGAGILAIVHDLPVFRSGPWADENSQLALVQAAFAMTLLAMNLVMQLALLYFIYTFVVGPAVHKVQDQYRQFHEKAFDEGGSFLPEEWAIYEGKEKLCQIGMSSPFFYFTVVFLWVLLIVREFRITERLARDLNTMPYCDSSKGMCKKTADALQVVALTPGTKVLLLLLVIVPKLLICSTLMWLGCQWLTATNSFSDLVMNSIAMEFVTGIDEALYETLLPVAHRRQVQEINFVISRRKSGGGRAKEFAAFQRSFVYLCISVSFVLAYKVLGQTVLPPHLHDLKIACADLISESASQICSAPFWTGSFGLGDCFPYGQ